MVPREAGRGRSFKGAGLYYLHDRDASTTERVAFTHTENVPTGDPHKALKWMAWTAIHAEEIKRESGVRATGRCCEKPVFTFSLAWHPEEDPQRWDMIRAGRRALVALGLHDHETVMVSHVDRPHSHLHLIVNTVHPETGRVNSVSYSKLKLSKWAEEYERENKIYCDRRIQNNARRAQGETVVYGKFDYSQINDLYHASDSGEAFRAALNERGFTLAQGRRPVIVDPDGTVHSLYRLTEGVKSKDIRAKLKGLQLPTLDDVRLSREETPDVKTNEAAQDGEHQSTGEEDKSGKEVREPTEPVSVDRDRQDRDWQESIIDAAITHEKKNPASPRSRSAPRTSEGRPRPPQPRPEPSPYLLNALQDRHLAELGSFYSKNAAGRSKLDATFEQQYGEHERTLRRDISHLDGLLKNSGWARRGWLRLTRQIPKNAQEELQSMRLNLDNIEWRKAEATTALQNDVERQRQAIEARHAEERQRLRPPESEAAHGSVREGENFSIDANDEPEEDCGPSFEY